MVLQRKFTKSGSAALIFFHRQEPTSAARHFELSRNTVAKLLAEEPAATTRGYQRQIRKTPVSDAALPYIDGWLHENERLRRWASKQCWMAHFSGIGGPRLLHIPCVPVSMRANACCMWGNTYLAAIIPLVATM